MWLVSVLYNSIYILYANLQSLPFDYLLFHFYQFLLNAKLFLGALI